MECQYSKRDRKAAAIACQNVPAIFLDFSVDFLTYPFFENQANQPADYISGGSRG